MPRESWSARAAAHAKRVDVWVQPHLARRRNGVKHPVHDFLFTYYSQRPAALRRWHPGWGVVLADAPEYADQKGYTSSVVEERPSASSGVEGRVSASVSKPHLESQLPLIDSIHRLLAATASRPPTLGCFGLHEWAMVHQAPGTIRHDWPLRLGARGTDEVVEGHRIACSHFDAFRFFTHSARPLNTLQPGRDDRVEFEQPGCLHAGMDLYKHAFRLTPWSRPSWWPTASSWRGTSVSSTCAPRRTTSATWGSSPSASRRRKESSSTSLPSAGSPNVALPCAND